MKTTTIKSIGVDLDSTLIKMTVCGKAAKMLGYDYKDVDVIDWYQSNFPDDMKHMILSMFNDPVIMSEDVEPIEGSQKKIKEWSESGHRIVLITARGPALVESTTKMVNLLYPEIKDINFVNFNESKIDTMITKNIDIYIDDAPHGVIDSMSLHIPTILVSNNYTKYNWKVRHHPKLHGIVKTIYEITDEQLNV